MADQHAQLDWDEQGQPTSRQYADVYFSRDNGLEETRYVFLSNNDLPQRFAALGPGEQLVIGETGFGTGMNFLCAWELFEQQAPAGARLHFVSVEKHPLTRADLQRALALWPSLQRYSEQLLDGYVGLNPGFQRQVFDAGRVVLTLLIGDAQAMLPQLDARIDAWFLDGFAPSKNPEMWTPELFAQLARLSTPQTTLGTFTATGYVRRALNEAGFQMKRVPGLGKKWEVMRGTFGAAANTSSKPWFARPAYRPAERRALVIGAGLAGCATAASLAARGWLVDLLERHAAIAMEASGNPQGVLYLKLSAHGTALSRLIVDGFGYTRRLLERLQKGQDWDNCGVLQLAFDDREAQRQTKLAAAFPETLLTRVDRQQAEFEAGIALESGGLFYPDAGWVHPPALCQHLIAHPNVHLHGCQHALQLKRVNGEWQAWSGEQLIASAAVVVLCGAADITRFEQSAQLPLKRIRGQISRLPASRESAALRTVVCAEGYVAPVRDGEHTLGASFNFDSDDLTPSGAEHASNLDLLRDISTDLAERLQVDTLAPDTLQGRAAFRCTSPDYLPIVGPLADTDAFAEAYAVLARDARQVPQIPCPWQEGLYINSGHGSRGLITAPLSGELIAAWLEGEPLPVPQDVAEACHPNRFMLRQLIRKG
ncbi:bifunctional tRNA (5-methylaminomethyl-2-thiouridine)(34)-methyltransferase MnmD/FAD-dependent 5-carboxymethylaminomethyl-2-thiouridine(34) oxidoreductase MnmC [Pseudomonas daroniae]|uniref:tRNA 5-methylaminomethyl-2-thiouridine biosynthesis bifunctional protein MnmC n=1 Tax=Phytopseudomonas daroniae TaxID=2487519 RepID=A0A4Q9QJ32_9GAMM|nr:MULTISPECIES: bifunctional tRNA (5-methylaminomethyl-2-thiouridine)(34)-methyltransferase MnmD/FAD-dependent 5-carboxymethylaminomethyl-2-thiouridine(34) oxidoreductase MnmC [Pseudomonas]TBU73421.1 bifunctional tRNA (5-methylaminomethyl-2-thiouridine)(34)-methyltransferase MnmD/FAD-dependent 5-carboxymethylaminomethyl-2-thiouridine(34) oxidoreductase MnmC [Pseudomonas daroniae]TBU79173.1 bifunctional tRNA (5-methylaminomethyl-2-thiouridine)(34)-methyltransferase MnmD/FAD-dependent 5-carboxymet